MEVTERRVRGWAVIAMGSMLAACGGDDGNTALAGIGTNRAPTTSETAPPLNRAPTIAGTPGTAVMSDTAYTFIPTGGDPDGDSLTYSISNAPAWATFDTATGQLSGTPEAQHVGSANDIAISVSDGKLTASLASFTLTVHAVATGSATLSWMPPTTNTDGSAMTNLAGYRVYWGNSAGAYPHSVTLDNPGLTAYVVTNLLPGTWFFAATALNSVGAESARSALASKTIH
jgi:hypothetical protein